MIYLYKKTHKVTGLQYLGKTSRDDPYSYPGSGKRWRAHLEKHGYEFDTEILYESTDKQEISKMGLYYSDLWNVVNDPMWANLKPESGDGGTFKHTTEAKEKIGAASRGRPSVFKGKKYDEIQQDPNAAAKRKEAHKQYMLEHNPFAGKTHSKSSKEKMSAATAKRFDLTDDERKARWGQLKGKPWSEARRAAQLARKLNKGKQ